MALPLSSRKTPPSPREVAKNVVDRLASPPGQAHKAEMTLRLTLTRAALEQLTAHAIEEGRQLEAFVQDVLERAAQESLTRSSPGSPSGSGRRAGRDAGAPRPRARTS